MQEEVENRTLTLVVSGTKLTGRLFKAAICKYLAHRKEKKLQKQRSRDAAVKKDRSSSPPKYLIFFKGRDADALTSAFTEYTNKKVKKVEKSERPSVLAKLSQFKELVKNAVVDRTKRKELER